MNIDNVVGQTNAMLGQVDGALGARRPSLRELRAIRRGMGIPAASSPDQERFTQDRRQSKRKVDFDTESESEEVRRTSKHFST